MGIDFEGAPVQPPVGVPAGWLENLAEDLRRHGPTALVIAGEYQPAAVHALAHALNFALGSVGTTIEYTESVEADPVDQSASLRELVASMHGGDVALLVILDGNPAYAAPVDVPFAAGLSHVETRVRLGFLEDETSALCNWHIPALHPLEGWSDVRAFDGSVTILQPLIAPLGDGHSVHELLAAFTDQPDAPSHAIVKGYWQRQYTGPDFDAFWRTSLHDGVVAGSALAAHEVKLRADWSSGVPLSAPPRSGSLEIVFRPDPSVGDGCIGDPNPHAVDARDPFGHIAQRRVAEGQEVTEPRGA